MEFRCVRKKAAYVHAKGLAYAVGGSDFAAYECGTQAAADVATEHEHFN